VTEIELPAALVEWLAPRLAPREGETFGEAPLEGLRLIEASRPAAGQSNDTVLFIATWTSSGGTSIRRDLVLRRQPVGQHIFLAPDVAREARVLAGLASAVGVPVPLVLGYESDPDVLGVPFFVMEHVEGRVPLARPSIHLVGWLPALSAEERRSMWESALDVMVAVHAVDWRSTHAFLLDGEEPHAAFTRHLERLTEWYRWTTRGRFYPLTDLALERLWAEHAAISTDDPVLVWGDSRVGNMIFDSDNQVAAAIDWEVATIGPAAIDVGHWLFFDEFATTASGVGRLDGWPDRATTIAEYERRSGRSLADLSYFELMEEFFMSTTLIRQSDFRVERGLSLADTRMGHDNAVTQMLARRLDQPVPDLSPDYIAHRSR
jgi:aminoglycoside phosphotransferase (APT) family kinase protein